MLDDSHYSVGGGALVIFPFPGIVAQRISPPVIKANNLN
jgi:hypothetical protein